MNEFKAPVIVFHGKHDSVTSYHNSEQFVYNAVRPYKKLNLFETGYHELQHDQEKDELLELGSKFLAELPEGMTKPFGKLNIKNIDTGKKKNHFIIKFIVVVCVIFILIRVLKSKGKTGVPLIWRIFNGLRGVKMSKK